MAFADPAVCNPCIGLPAMTCIRGSAVMFDFLILVDGQCERLSCFGPLSGRPKDLPRGRGLLARALRHCLSNIEPIRRTRCMRNAATGVAPRWRR